MIASWKDEWLRKFFEEDIHSKNSLPDLRYRLFRKLQMLDYAETYADLRVLPSNHLEQLSGKLEGWRSIRVNVQWRLIFQWDEGQANNVYLDNHTCR